MHSDKWNLEPHTKIENGYLLQRDNYNVQKKKMKRLKKTQRWEWISRTKMILYCNPRIKKRMK